MPTWGNDAFPSCLRFPPNSEKNSDSLENFNNFTFSTKFFDFHPSKFLMTFFVIPPLFSMCQYISPISEKYYFPHTLANFPPLFRQIYVFFTFFMCFSYPP